MMRSLFELNQILSDLLQEVPLSPAAWQALENWELSDPVRSRVFGITSENVQTILQQRSHLFQSIYGGHDFNEVLQRSELIWQLWLPLAMQLVRDRESFARPLIQGILGGQGTGKTTLAKNLSLILEKLGYRTLSVSLDDLYKTYAERMKLREIDPRLIWRGPPGTHDIDLGIQILDQLRSPKKPVVAIPRFDKSAYGGVGDRAEFERVEKIDIVLFEGWFVGVRPINPAAFDQPPPPILTAEDRQFAQDINDQLSAYLPLWERLDRLMILHPIDYRLSLQWRQQAEHEMMATGKSGMSDLEITNFVHYFWKALHPELFIKPLIHSQNVDLVIEIKADHSVKKIYGKSEEK